MAIVASQIVAQVSVQGASQAQAQLRGVGDASNAASANLAKMVAGGVVVAGAALVAFGAKSVQMAANFQLPLLRSRPARVSNKKILKWLAMASYRWLCKPVQVRSNSLTACT